MPLSLCNAPVRSGIIKPTHTGLVHFSRRPGKLELAPSEPAAPLGDDPQSRSLGLSTAAATRSFWLLVFALFAYYFYSLFVNRHIIALLRDNDSFGYTVPAVLVSWFAVAPTDFPEFTKSMFEVVGLPGKLLAG